MLNFSHELPQIGHELIKNFFCLFESALALFLFPYTPRMCFYIFFLSGAVFYFLFIKDISDCKS